MRGRIVGGVGLGLTLVLGSPVSVAQTKGNADRQATDEAEEQRGQESETAAGAEAESTTQSGDPELDAPPPKTAVAAGEKLSPLNPDPKEFPDKDTTAAPGELSALLSDIAALRGRVAALTTSLFRSKLKIYGRVEGDESVATSLVVTLDDGVVFRASDRFTGDGERPLYEHAVAPGNHVIGVEIERHDARGQTYKSWQSTKFAVTVPESRLLEADILLEDDSDMADEFPDDQDGEYELTVELRARVAE